jgi:hypothetical protein
MVTGNSRRLRSFFASRCVLAVFAGATSRDETEQNEY